MARERIVRATAQGALEGAPAYESIYKVRSQAYPRLLDMALSRGNKEITRIATRIIIWPSTNDSSRLQNPCDRATGEKDNHPIIEVDGDHIVATMGDNQGVIPQKCIDCVTTTIMGIATDTQVTLPNRL